ncbi:hypothetical protein [Candidatus Nitrososphaera sp. FF02]|uniref:hypothetical protein n=1 Tax=Candidatus Nitrososphaera sp. FF02 TaxID=3398226 RepID=UPI0039E76BE4
MGFGGIEGPEKKKRLVWSMALLAGVVVAAGAATMAVTDYLRSQDPIYQCVADPLEQPYQLSVPISVTEDGAPAVVRAGVGVSDGCTLPVHTLEENVIHVAWKEPYGFTLGHFVYNWLGQDLVKYDTTAYVNNQQHEGSILDIPLRQGDSIRLELATRN